MATVCTSAQVIGASAFLARLIFAAICKRMEADSSLCRIPCDTCDLPLLPQCEITFASLEGVRPRSDT